MRSDPLAYLPTELDSLKAQGLHRTLRQLSGEQGPRATFDGRSVVNLSSNNYLGLTTTRVLKARAIEAIEQLGVGSGAVRTIAGTMDIHMELERRLADVQAGRSRRRLPERLHRQRRHGLVDPRRRKTSSSPTR